VQTNSISSTWAGVKRKVSIAGRLLQFGPAGSEPARAQLAGFLRLRRSSIVDSAWARMAGTQRVLHTNSEPVRVHAQQLLNAIASDLQSQPLPTGAAPTAAPALALTQDTSGAAGVHAELQKAAAFTVDDVTAEFDALRYCTMQAWKAAGHAADADSHDAMTSFNVALDAALRDCLQTICLQSKTSTERFIGVLAHDIRNPLATLSLGVQQLLGQGRIDPPTAKRMLNSTRRIAGIVEQVADFTRGHSPHGMPLRRTEGDLRSHIIKVVEETQAQHPARVIVFESKGHFQGYWDEGRVGQLVSNLLGNAIQHGAPDGEVRMTLHETDGAPEAVEISVHNDGPGIPPAERTTLFDPLSRGDRATRDVAQGLGLGLFICREIVRAHGGTLRVESSDEAGTLFVATLPTQRPERARAAAAPEREPSSGAPQAIAQ
jgi:signal transduction histidine kinase